MQMRSWLLACRRVQGLLDSLRIGGVLDLRSIEGVDPRDGENLAQREHF